MKIGLVLSGGGARAIAHLGMIQALEQAGLKFHMVSGASAGALAGALYCAGYSPEEICSVVERTNFMSVFRPAFNWRSLLNIEKASEELKKYFPEDNFASLKIPLRVATTDITKGTLKVFKKGQLIKPVLASCCIPVVFDPIKIGKRTLVDGGIVDNLPIKPIKKECDRIIALHCNPVDKGYQVNNWRDLMERSMMITMTGLVHEQARKADVFLEPPGIGKYGVFEFKKSRELFDAGYDYARQQIESGVLKSLKLKHEKVLL